MLISNRLNVTLIKKDSIPLDQMDKVKELLKEKYNTNKITIITDFGTEDKFIVFDEITLKTLIC
jgi:hypothetical protein